jgi:hypothetical protein
MSEYFDHVERELRAAVRRHAHVPWYIRLSRRHPRGLVVVFAVLVIAAPAAAAVSLLRSGSSVPASQPLTPRAFNGVGIRSSVRLLALRVADPVAGPPWGMQLVRTSRGLECVQVGRVAFGTVGALGRDGAFGNDGRFHPFSVDYQSGPPCVAPDARGNGFLNVAEYGVPTSALVGDDQGCRPGDRCPKGDLRNLYFGLLGPDATSVTHLTAGGRLATTPTSGADGAYLIVLPDTTPSLNNGFTYDAAVVPGAVRSVHYRDGHSCTVRRRLLADCPPVGYVPSSAPVPTEAQVRAPVRTQVEVGKAWCVPPGPLGQAEACPSPIPRGLQKLSGGPPSALLTITFTSRTAVTTGRSYYYISFGNPPHHDPRYRFSACAGGGQFGQTNSDYAAGQRVVQSMFVPLGCEGTARGDVTLVIQNGPAQAAPMPAVPGQSVGREVGSFNFVVP